MRVIFGRMWVILSLQVAAALQLASEAPENCYRYMCAEEQIELPADQCVYFTNNTYMINPCNHWASDWYCPPVPPETNSTCGYFPAISNQASSWPNEPCIYSATCVEGLSCVNFKCQGLQQKAPCQVHDQCAPGLACIKGQCWQQIPTGMKGCLTDYDCVNGAGCNAGQCTAYLSIPPGETVYNCENSTSLLCESRYCTEERCVGNVTSQYELPHECQTDSDCMSEDGTFATPCTCGMNPWGKSYCGLFPGDPLGVELTDVMQEWVSGNYINRCNTVRRFVLECMVQVWFFAPYNLYNYYTLATTNYAQIQGIDDCTLRVFQRPYRDADMEFVVVSWAQLAVFSLLVFA